jgi:uncharacterized protein (DUF58 family)
MPDSRLQIISKRLVNSIFSGAYKSVFKGRGIEFDSLCEYQPGDDIRSIDWNVTARTGSPFIRHYAEEREMTVVLMLDVSASMYCPSPWRPKNEVAAEICALLATAAAHNNDRTGVLAFSGQVERYIPPQKGIRHARRLIAEIAANTASSGLTDLAGALAYLQKVTRRPIILFVVSDFICADFSVALSAAARCHDVVVVAVNDPQDIELPDVGLLQMADAESGCRRLIDTSSRKVRAAYMSHAANLQSAIQQTIAATKADLLTVNTTTSPIHALSYFFHSRQQRLRHAHRP